MVASAGVVLTLRVFEARRTDFAIRCLPPQRGLFAE